MKRRIFNKIVKLCEQRGFLRRIVYQKLNEEIFKIESTGALLQRNLYTEWFNAIVINKDISVFFSDNDISTTLQFAKDTCMEMPPFAVAQIDEKKRTNQPLVKSNDEKSIDFQKYFDTGSIFKCWIFVAPDNSTPLFHQWMRQRRMWWRKFSASPGRYNMTDLKTIDDVQTVEIMAKYPWGDQLVETLTLGQNVKNIAAKDLQMKSGKKTLQLYNVSSEINAATLFLNTLCDAYEEPLFQGNPRPLLRFHRKLAPYNVSFAISSAPKAVVDELKDLALYLCRQLRSNQMSCLLTPVSYKNTLEAQWTQYDQMGIPYNVLLNEKTLKDGIVQLRSRDTTLKEQVHVTELTNYVEQLFRNY